MMFSFLSTKKLESRIAFLESEINRLDVENINFITEAVFNRRNDSYLNDVNYVYSLVRALYKKLGYKIPTRDTLEVEKV